MWNLLEYMLNFKNICGCRAWLGTTGHCWVPLAPVSGTGTRWWVPASTGHHQVLGTEGYFLPLPLNKGASPTIELLKSSSAVLQAQTKPLRWLCSLTQRIESVGKGLY